MSSSLVITIAAIAAVVWLAYLGVSALRARGKEEVPPNLAPGATDDVLETRRLERVQQGAVLLSAVLAVGLPLYYLGEQSRQEGFVEQFEEESLHRGEELVAEFQCWNCHGPDGVGGAAAFIDARTGVEVSWAAPSLNDIFFRYGREEVVYWTTYGRGNSPMPAWGLDGGGPMNEAQVEDVVNYIQSIQVEQPDAVATVEATVAGALSQLAGADETLDGYILEQRQVIQDLQRGPEQLPALEAIAEEAAVALEGSEDGIDTDGDGVSDSAEIAISEASQAAFEVLRPSGLEAVTFDPNDPESTGRPDAETAEEVVANLESLVSGGYPILEANLAEIEAALAESGDDADGDGLTDTAEQTLTTQLALAVEATVPANLEVVELDPTNPESEGEPDLVVARRVVAELETIVANLQIEVENQDALLESAQESLDALLQKQERRQWEVDIQGVADSTFGGDLETAERAVGLFYGYCSRCHTASWSAGAPFALEAGSGGFGPALWDGRPQVQFATEEDLYEFLLVGARLNEPYGINGFGNGQMPGFGQTLSGDDIDLIVRYLWEGDLSGMREP